MSPGREILSVMEKEISRIRRPRNHILQSVTIGVKIFPLGGFKEHTRGKLLGNDRAIIKGNILKEWAY
jgi:hypothetical protein